MTIEIILSKESVNFPAAVCLTGYHLIVRAAAYVICIGVPFLFPYR